ncbi:MAG: glycoside hydrolase family 31 protein, partial [Prevotella sp.]|nr:glycoside hydrolase family 31 protein [Prevotella sp.]
MNKTVSLSFRIVTAVLFAVSAAQAGAQSTAPSPLANPAAVVTCGGARFTVLTPEMIRIEYSETAQFEDRATFTIVNRNLDVPSYMTTDDGTYLYITTERLSLKYRKGSDPRTVPASPDNLSVTIDNNGTPAYWYPGKPDPLNLKGTCRTLDGLTGDSKRSDMEAGVISRSGWAVVDDSWSATRSDGGRSYALVPDADMGYPWWNERADAHAMDVYLFAYGRNYRKAVADYISIAGRIPLPPDYVFGYWYSKYASYSADDYRQIISDLKNNNIPTDVMILDMDWHWNGNASSMSEGRGGWTGWSWNTNLIPDAKGLLQEMHANNFKTALNLHPADGINKTESPYYFKQMNSQLSGKYLNSNKDNISWSLDWQDFTKSFFSTIIRDHESEGVDFWWLDWQQWLTDKKVPGLSNTFWCNYIWFSDMQRQGKKRPMLYHRWGGLGNHRYQIGFSGDAYITWKSLDYLPYFNSTASNVLYGYWSHDIGGHMSHKHGTPVDPQLYTRAMQMGEYLPILRSHSTKDPALNKEPWAFDKPVQQRLKAVVDGRYALVPYIYTMCRQAHETGISLCRPMYYDYPEANEAYTYKNEYMFGDNLLIAPITQPIAQGEKYSQVDVWLPEGKWLELATGTMLQGGATFKRPFSIDEYPVYVKAGSLLPYFGKVNNLSGTRQPVTLRVFPGGNSGEFTMYEDNGEDARYETEYATTPLSYHRNGNQLKVTIGARTGSYADMPAKRHFTVALPCQLAPIKAEVNGVPAECSYNGHDLEATIDCGEINCATGAVITLTLPDGDTTIADGTKARMNRLRTAVAEYKQINCGLVYTERFGFLESAPLR